MGYDPTKEGTKFVKKLIKHIEGPSSGWQLTWRNAMVHWGEGRGGWVVHGSHYMRDSSGRTQLVSDEIVNNCSIYDGWWDRNK